MEKVTVIGAGLAGCEAAYQLAKRGIAVKLIECKPIIRSPAHQTNFFAELVCSNSLKSMDLGTASGVLKEELFAMDCLLLNVAKECRVAAGNALAVDRDLFAQKITKTIQALPQVTVEHGEATDFNANEYTILATGPLTLDILSQRIIEVFGENLHFYDAAAPIISADSIDMQEVFAASRYGKGSDDYLNCAFTKEQYCEFIAALVSAESAILKDFEKREIFEGCMPIEVMAKRGADSLRFGPLKPMGIAHPTTGKRPYAVVQLRAENEQKTMYNLVGFQTNLKFKEQKRVFSLVPGLNNAEFLRYGVMHRNSFVHAPKTMRATFQTIKHEKVFIAGQLCGVEGYVESIASGLMAGINTARLIQNKEPLVLPSTTILGSLSRYLTIGTEHFQPMNANFGLLPPFEPHIKDKDQRKAAFGERSKKELTRFLGESSPL